LLCCLLDKSTSSGDIIWFNGRNMKLDEGQTESWEQTKQLSDMTTEFRWNCGFTVITYTDKPGLQWRPVWLRINLKSTKFRCFSL
jgi:hypothetical protein